MKSPTQRAGTPSLDFHPLQFQHAAPLLLRKSLRIHSANAHARLFNAFRWACDDHSRKKAYLFRKISYLSAAPTQAQFLDDSGR